MTKKTARADWTALEEGTVRIGTDAPTRIRMPAWHWRTLAYLEDQHGVDVPGTLARFRQLVPDLQADDVVMWYVDLTFDTLQAAETEEPNPHP